MSHVDRPSERDILKAISPAMRVAGGVALQLASGDLFGLLADLTAESIAVSVYTAMYRQSMVDRSRTTVRSRRSKVHMDHQTKVVRHGLVP